MNQIIVGMGEALWDVLPEGKKIGGAPANFAYHVSQFGFDSRVVSAVGRDELGDEILKVFKEKNLNYFKRELTIMDFQVLIQKYQYLLIGQIWILINRY